MSCSITFAGPVGCIAQRLVGNAAHTDPATAGACVFGVSMGGMITQVLALRHPERLGRLVLGCTHSAGHYTQLPSADYGRALRAPPAAAVPMHGEGAAGMRDEEARRATEAAAEAYDRKMHAFNYTDAWVQRNARRVDAIFAWGRRATRSTEGTLAQYLAVREFVKGDAAAHDAALRRGVRSPVLVIHGDSDGIVPVGNGRRLLRALPPCLTSWYLVPGGGHGGCRTPQSPPRRSPLTPRRARAFAYAPRSLLGDGRRRVVGGRVALPRRRGRRRARGQGEVVTTPGGAVAAAPGSAGAAASGWRERFGVESVA